MTTNLDEGLQRLNHTNKCGEKVIHSSAATGLKDQVQVELSQLNNQWQQLNGSLSQCAGNLDTQLAKWNVYEDVYGGLLRWLTHVEADLQTHVTPKGEVVEKKAQLDKYKVSRITIYNISSK